MPSHPPETKFYENDDNATLWRDISRIFEDFAGEDPSQWPAMKDRFGTVLEDTLVRLRESKVQK